MLPAAWGICPLILTGDWQGRGIVNRLPAPFAPSALVLPCWPFPAAGGDVAPYTPADLPPVQRTKPKL
jgi:hypothetical protein